MLIDPLNNDIFITFNSIYSGFGLTTFILLYIPEWETMPTKVREEAVTIDINHTNLTSFIPE